MEQLSKIVTRQDANFKLSPSPSNETSINLSKEISALISDESGDVTFMLYKSDFIKALAALCIIPQIYLKKNQDPSSVSDIFASLSNEIAAQFDKSETAPYTVYLFKRDDGRAYFNNLKQDNGFNLRAFLVEKYSTLTFIKNDNGTLSIRINTSVPDEALLKGEPLIPVNYAIITPLKKSYELQELAEILNEMYASSGYVGIHLFGLKYGQFLSDANLKELCRLAKIPESYNAELNKMRNLYYAIKEHKYGVCFYEDFNFNLKEAMNSAENLKDTTKDYLRAMRTKPFLLLAGISGTGKSRIVKQMAFDSCPNNDILRSDLTAPGNYCLIEVKPNWHDSTELLGYESNIGTPHYQLTPFVKFLAKAMLYPTVPFFVCLDEMNLAPVEQYFAEFLSVLESRTKIAGHIVSEPLVKADVFKKYNLRKALFSVEKEKSEYSQAQGTVEPEPTYGKEAEVYDFLEKYGLRIPENVIVIGTVNMDETTHQFSRKVIDRAMTIEMNLPDGDPFMDFFDHSSELVYHSEPTSPSLYLATETKASDIVKALAEANAEKTDWLKGAVASFLTELNTALDGTPFKVAYRVQNELMLYFYQLWLEDKSLEWEIILNTACDQILMMKVLPRIEGDEELLEKPLERLDVFCEQFVNAKKKIKEMSDRLGQSRFTSFWP